MIGKKGQGLSLNTIIVAIIVLVVLVVLIMVFTGYFGRIFTPQIANECLSQGGKCVPNDATSTDDCGSDAFGNSIPERANLCPVATDVCCVSSGLG